MFDFIPNVSAENLWFSFLIGAFLFGFFWLMAAWVIDRLNGEDSIFGEEEIPADHIKTGDGKIIHRDRAARALMKAKGQDGSDLRVSSDRKIYTRDAGGTLRKQKDIVP